MSGRSRTAYRADPAEWAEQTFGACKLGDIRRRDRVVALAAQAAAHPSRSIGEMYGADKAGLEFLQLAPWRFVIRANHDRRLATAHGTALRDHMAKQPVRGTYTLALAPRGP